ncbi:hypothetical protein [Roseiconus lacunae]|uniref:Uncharacterized protein n=1 Tax=Roseiconus lacunae TaxID=2605694 RepID=A0ABT7PHQ6_9BACT|nr:hypothetical protein [Roseiconus lacunae]MDM4015863.1 hypothetical protein [Roseiconus lacunae]
MKKKPMHVGQAEAWIQQEEARLAAKQQKVDEAIQAGRKPSEQLVAECDECRDKIRFKRMRLDVEQASLSNATLIVRGQRVEVISCAKKTAKVQIAESDTIKQVSLAEIQIWPSSQRNADDALNRHEANIVAAKVQYAGAYRSWAESVGAELREAKSILQDSGNDAFLSWCKNRFGWSKPYVYCVLAAARVLAVLRQQNYDLYGRLPENESQCRELARVDESQVAELWCRSCETADDRGCQITANLIKQVRESANDAVPFEPLDPGIDYEFDREGFLQSVQDGIDQCPDKFLPHVLSDLRSILVSRRIKSARDTS